MARRHPLESLRSRLTPRVRRNILVSVPRGVRLRHRRADRGLDPRLRRQQLPLHRRAGRLRPRPGLEGLRRRRPADHRSRPGAAHRGAARRDVAVRAGGLHRHRGQAVLRAPRHRLGPRLRAPSRTTCSRCAWRKGSPPSRCSSPAISGPRTSAGATSRCAGSCARRRWRGRSRSATPRTRSSSST